MTVSHYINSINNPLYSPQNQPCQWDQSTPNPSTLDPAVCSCPPVAAAASSIWTAPWTRSTLGCATCHLPSRHGPRAPGGTQHGALKAYENH